MMLKRIIETYPRRFHFRSLVCLLNILFTMVNVANILFTMVNVAQQLPEREYMEGFQPVLYGNTIPRRV